MVLHHFLGILWDLSSSPAAPGAPCEAQRRRPCPAARRLRPGAGRDLRTGGRGEAGGAEGMDRTHP